MSRLKTRSVTVINREKTGEDPDYGNDVMEDVETVVTGCAVQPQVGLRMSSENTEARQQVTTGLRLWAPFNAPISATSAIDVDGVRYEVDGDVGRWVSSIASSRSHLEVNLRRVTG